MSILWIHVATAEILQTVDPPPPSLSFRMFDCSQPLYSPAVWHNLNPLLDHRVHFASPHTSQRLLDYLQSSAVVLELWGLQGENGERCMSDGNLVFTLNLTLMGMLVLLVKSCYMSLWQHCISIQSESKQLIGAACVSDGCTDLVSSLEGVRMTPDGVFIIDEEGPTNTVVSLMLSLNPLLCIKQWEWHVCIRIHLHTSQLLCIFLH